MLGRFHLGCGDHRLEGFTNVDVRETPAADVVADLSTLDDALFTAATCLFSNAFFEHLYRPARLPHLTGARDALADDGVVCYLGIPDFRAVARLYLDRAPGILGPTFDLYHAYRYTHGDPDGVDGWYLEQLHKSLFDADELDGLLSAAGFPAHLVFSYVYPGEPVPVTLGFYASASPRGRDELEADLRGFVAAFDGGLLDASTLTVLAGATR